MCIAISKPINKKLDKSIYEKCFSNNDDGAGFAFILDGELYTAKGFFTFEEFWEHFEPLEDKAQVIHFRVGTSGGNNAENCHPWRVSDDLIFVHNGTLPINKTNYQLSDTGNFNDDILKPLYEKDPDFWKRPEFKWMIENSIGANNKLILLGKDGEVRIFNESAGVWEGDVWFSNTSYRAFGKKHCSYNVNNYHNTTTTKYNTSPSKITLEDFDNIDVDELDKRLEEYNAQ